MRWIFVAELLFVMFILVINSGNTLNCYVCRSDEDKDCDDVVNNTYSVTCPEKSNDTKMYCRKILQKLRFKNEKDNVKIRECAYEKGSRDCYFYKWIELAFQETCECDHDNCNGGLTVTPNVRLLAVTFFLSLMIFLTER